MRTYPHSGYTCVACPCKFYPMTQIPKGTEVFVPIPGSKENLEESRHPECRDQPGFWNDQAAACTCVVSCADDPATACSLSGISHVHPDDGRGIFGPCPVHPDAPGDH